MIMIHTISQYIGVGSRGVRGAVAPLDFWLYSVTESRSGVK